MVYDVKQLLKSIEKSYGVCYKPHYGSFLELIGPFTVYGQRNKTNVFIGHEDATLLYAAILNEERIIRTVSFNDIVQNILKIKMTRRKALSQKRWTVFDITQLTDISKFFQLRAVRKQRSVMSSHNHCANYYITTDNLPSKILSVDFEMYEFKNNEITEVGYVMIDPHNQQMSETVHIIIQDYIHRENRKYVPNHRDRFQYGKSVYMTYEQACEHLSDLLTLCDGILAHGGQGSDNKVLKQMCGNDYESLMHFNTDHLSFALTGTKRQYKLCNLAEIYGIDCSDISFHNAGNDAHVTAKTFLNMLNVLKMVDVQAA